MDTVRSFVEFISSYPFWAKTLIGGNLACILVIIILAPRSQSKTPDDKNHAKDSGLTIAKDSRLTITHVLPYDDRPISGKTSEIQVSIFVNGMEFQYPSLAGVSWVEVGREMAPQEFRLPKASEYRIRFEMRRRHVHGNAPPEVFASQREVTLRGSIADYRYEVYRLDERDKVVTHASIIGAYIFLSLNMDP